MELLATYRKLYSLRYCPISLVQIVFATGTIWLLGAVRATSGLRVAKEELRKSLSQAAGKLPLFLVHVQSAPLLALMFEALCCLVTPRRFNQTLRI